uniref:Uncharacterized protein n=1 Tax=Sphaerodactylus townsendi TaxID=933632 RepID=A0ACB8EE34_9SAUR
MVPPSPRAMRSTHKNEQPETLKPRPLGLKQGLAGMYQEELLCDVTLIVDGQTFPCHRALLAAISSYFRDIFIRAQPDVKEILLTNVTPSTVQTILKYIYTEEITLTPEQAPDIFTGASQMQIVPLQDICCSTEEQVGLCKELEKWGDLKLEWKNLDSQERLREAGGLRQGMCKPHIVCVDTQMREHQRGGREDAFMACYEPQAEKWEKLPGLQSLTHACCTAGDDKIYISGGVCRNSYSSALYEFDPFKCQWAELPSMATPRCVHGFLFYNQRLFAVGGWCKFQSFLNSAESFDLEMKTWAEMSQLPFALSHPASCVFRKKLYFLGGATGILLNWVFHRGLLIYDANSNAWTQVPLSTGFFAAGAVAVDHGIYVIGGFSEKKLRNSDEGGPLQDNRQSSRKCFFVNKVGQVSYNVRLPKLPRGIANAGVVCCDNRIYVLGGEDLRQRYKTIYHWEPGENRWHPCAKEIPISREGISRFGCAILMRPKPHILKLFQKPSCAVVAAVCK